jgi:hypothetical protein
VIPKKIMKNAQRYKALYLSSRSVLIMSLSG